MTTVKRGVFAGAAAFGFLKAWKQNRKAKRAARKAKRDAPPDEIDEPFFSDDKETVMLSGYKTYLGIATAALGFVLGLLGVGDTESAALSAQIVGALDQVLTVGGLLLAAYGRAKAKPAG